MNWACTMDVAIRAANWLVGGRVLSRGRRSGCAVSCAGSTRAFTSTGGSSAVIWNAASEGTANHYLADIVGLLFIAVYCPFFRESRRWRRFCIRELIREMDGQVYADGCHFEASTCYHRLALELFFFATVLVAIDEGASTGDGVPAGRGKGVRAGLHGEAARDVRGGSAPAEAQRADAPDRRQRFRADSSSSARSDVLDMRYLLSLGAVFFQRSAVESAGVRLAEDVLWVFGRQGHDAWNRLAGRSVGDHRGQGVSRRGMVRDPAASRLLPGVLRVQRRPRPGRSRPQRQAEHRAGAGRPGRGRRPGHVPATRRTPIRGTGSGPREAHNTVAVDRCEQAELSARFVPVCRIACGSGVRN